VALNTGRHLCSAGRPSGWALAHILVNIVIVKLRDSGAGCLINNIFIGCVLYADDIIVLSAAVSGLQEMLNICNKTITDMDLSRNYVTVKSLHVCLRFGPVCKYTITDMYIGSSTITCCNSIRYLGVSVTCMNFSELTRVVYEHFRSSTMSFLYIVCITVLLRYQL